MQAQHFATINMSEWIFSYSQSASRMNKFEESHLLNHKSSWMRRYVENVRMHSVNRQISLRGTEKKSLEKCP